MLISHKKKIILCQPFWNWALALQHITSFNQPRNQQCRVQMHKFTKKNILKLLSPSLGIYFWVMLMAKKCLRESCGMLTTMCAYSFWIYTPWVCLPVTITVAIGRSPGVQATWKDPTLWTRRRCLSQRWRCDCNKEEAGSKVAGSNPGAGKVFHPETSV